MILHLVSDLQRALEIKARLDCPHIHFIIEEDCDAFTAGLVWMEVLTRAADLSSKANYCVISYIDLSKHNDTLNQDDIKFLQSMQAKLDKKMIGFEVIRE
jgi:hypothetical protein